LASVEGNGSKVQLTTGSAPPSPVTTALLTAAGYTLLGGSAVTNSDGSSTVINGGNIGSYPTNTITPGTPAWTLDGGTAVVTAVAQNQTDLAAAIAAYQALGPGTTIPTALDGQSLAPGTYSSLSGTFTLSGGTLTLNGAGVYVFLAATTLTLTGASQIVLTNGATAANVVFVCGSSMTAAANSGTQFNGNILASVSITVDGGVYNGRLLAHTGAVTISTATVINAPIQGGVIAAGDVVIYDANGNVVSSGVLLSSLGGAAGVTSFNGRSGAVSPTSGDYSVAQVTGAAPLASPTFTGVPAAPTAAPLTNSTQIATTAYADAAVAVEVAARTTAVSAAITTAETFATTADTTVLSTAEAFATAADAAYAPLAGAAFTGPVSITFGGVGLTVNAELNMGNNQTLLMGANGHLFMSSSSLNDGTSSPGANGQPLTSTITGVAWSNSVSAASGQDFVINSTGTNKVRINTGANVFDFFGSTGGMNLGAQNASIAISVAGVISLSSAPSTKISLAPGTVVNISGVPGPYANNAAATGAGLTAGDVYYTAADPRTLAVVF
jgi:hypothetical protein